MFSGIGKIKKTKRITAFLTGFIDSESLADKEKIV